VTYRRPLRAAGLVLALSLAPSTAAGQSTESVSPVTTAEELVRVARGHEKERRWDEALQAWFRVLHVDRMNVEAREAIPRTVRNALQAHRHRDPSFQARLLAMSPADVMALYVEVLGKVQSHYVDADKVTITRLFRQGLEEYLAALGDPNFVAQHLKGADPDAVTTFRTNLRKAWSGREVETTREAMLAVAQIGNESKRLLRLRTINPVVCEFICGACNCLDEYSAYLSASQYMAESAGSPQPSVHVRPEDGGVVYIRISHFQPSTPQEVEDVLKTLTQMGAARAIILDLRGNTGGFFPSAVKTAQRFLPAGIIVTAIGPHHDANQVYTSTTGNAATDLPLVVLVDAETASAAEVLAVALRDNQRARLIGTATFGKGTVQKVVAFETAEEIDPDTGKRRPRAAVRITLARLLGPSGTPITGVGVTPDQLVPDRNRQFDAALEHAKELARRYMPGMGMTNGMSMRD
jgi:C-terminal processing protease CtpA/Prc